MLMLLFLLLVEPVHKEIIVETFDGEVYVIGSGDDCWSAWDNHGPIPSDFRSIECR
jgi:hypothetical protein